MYFTWGCGVRFSISEPKFGSVGNQLKGMNIQLISVGEKKLNLCNIVGERTANSLSLISEEMGCFLWNRNVTH